MTSFAKLKDLTPHLHESAMKTNIFVAILLITSGIGAYAQDKYPTPAWSYTSEEMRAMATAFQTVIVEANTKSSRADTVTLTHAAAFKGYIAAILDLAVNKDVKLMECAQNLRLNEITYRTAVIIAGAPLNRSDLAVAGPLIALRMVCDGLSINNK